MSSSALRTFALVLIALALLFGVAAYYMNRTMTAAPDAKASSPEPAQSSVMAVVATKPLAAYAKIKPDDVVLVPVAVAPPQYFDDVADVVGREPVRSVGQGVPLTNEAFGSPSALAAAIPPGTEAMSLSISDVIAVGGFVKPGDFVDVLLYLRSSGDQVADSQARILLRNVRVLAYQEKLINASKSAKDDDTSRRERTAVVAVPDKLITRVMLGASLGELRLALRRPVEDESQTDTPMVAADSSAGEALSAEAPSAESPVAQDVAMTATASAAVGGTGAADDASDVKDQQVITLKELSQIKKQRERAAPAKRPVHHAPTRARIEVFEGAQAHQISRPY